MTICETIIQLTQENFDQVVHQHNIVFIDFWAKWCAPCKSFAIIFAKVAEQNADIQFCKIDIEQEPQLAQDFNVMSIPHLLVLKEDIAIFSDSGSLPLVALQDLVAQARNADVSAVKAKIAAQESSQSES